MLRRRDEESTITKSQQKRKLNKLQDVFNGLRQRLAEQEHGQRAELQQLTTDIRWERSSSRLMLTNNAHASLPFMYSRIASSILKYFAVVGHTNMLACVCSHAWVIRIIQTSNKPVSTNSFVFVSFVVFTNRTPLSPLTSLSPVDRRLTDMLVDVGERNQHFLAVHSRQLHQIFQMTHENCRRQLDKVVRADRVIHEQQLGLPFSPPDLDHLAPPQVRCPVHIFILFGSTGYPPLDENSLSLPCCSEGC